MIVLTKELFIHEVKGRPTKYIPVVKFNLEIITGPGSSMTLDEQTCKQFGIPMSLNIIGKSLRCTVETRLQPIDERADYGPHDVVVSHMFQGCKVQPWSHSTDRAPAEEKDWSILLKTHYRGGTLSEVPIPEYELKLDLTEDEYAQMKKRIVADKAYTISLAMIA